MMTKFARLEFELFTKLSFLWYHKKIKHKTKKSRGTGQGEVNKRALSAAV
jgi:hypothetical protein